MEKHYSLDINFVCPGMPFQGDTLESDKSLGGSETACISMARELSRRGHKVIVFSRCDTPGIYDGVDYKPFDAWPQYMTQVPFDVAVVQRTPEAFSLKLESKVNILWQHDLAQRSRAQTFNGILWNVDRVLTVSDWHRKQYAEVMGQAEDVFYATRNGIDVERIKAIPSIGRNRKVLIYTSRPERGLDILLFRIFPKMLERDPELELRIAGYDNTVPQMAAVYAGLRKRAAEFGDKVKWLGPLSKTELYRQYRQAGLYIYPTPSDGEFIHQVQPQIDAGGVRAFREVSCITVMECAAAGLPFISSAIGALTETAIPGAGTLVDADTKALWDEDHCHRFVDAAMAIINDEEAWKTCSEIGHSQAERYSWAPVAEDWERLFHDIIAKKNASRTQLVRHFLRRSDIIAAKAIVDNPQSEEEKELFSLVELHWGKLLHGDDGIRTQYETIGEGHDDVFVQAGNEPRLQYACEWLNNKPEIANVLDVGCAHGAYSIHASNLTGRNFLGVDVDKHSVALARKWAQDSTRCKDVSRAQFATVEDFKRDVGKATYDCMWALEVLEHVPDPTSFIDDYEKHVKPGGKVLITVPYGPWEYMSYHTYPHRCHIWEYDLHDLRDLFRDKKDCTFRTMPAGRCDDLDTAIGWRWVEYTVDGTPTGKIDMTRKLALQAPRQSVSVVMIAGNDPQARPPEDTLHWCLRSLHHVADEIIIGDCGLSDEAKRIIAQHAGYLYDIKVIPASDPKQAGYETPRNEMLQHARQEWVFWIDTDETLLGVKEIQKYLRASYFDGYGIRQWHFTCDDARFNPDRPVRLYRRVGNDGRSCQWFGMIHEHPEKALNEGPGPVVVLTDVNIAHVGYLNEPTRRRRFDRNLPLLGRDIEKYPERLLQKHFIMRDKVQMSKYKMQQNGGRITPDIRGDLEDVIAIWREHFKAKNNLMSNDSLQFYSEAVTILNPPGSFEIGFGFAHAKSGLNGADMQPMRVKFASKDDVTAELSSRMDAAVANYDTIYW